MRERVATELEKRREVVEDRKARKVCTKCGVAPAADGLTQCRACLDKTNARRQGKSHGGAQPVRSMGELNECCVAFGFHRFDCSAVPLAKRAIGPLLPTETRRQA